MVSFQDQLEAAKKRQWQSSRYANKWVAMNRESSVASTSTLRASTPADFGYRETLQETPVTNDEMDLDLPEQQLPDDPKVPEEVRTLIVATDFGTTFSSVAFAAFENESISDVEFITNYPDAPLVFQRKNLQVPTESGYPVTQILDEIVEVDEEAPPEDVLGIVDSEDLENEAVEDDDGEEEDDPLGIYGDVNTANDMDLDIQGDQADGKVPYWGYDVFSQSRRANINNPDIDVRLITRSKLIASFIPSRD